MTLPPNFNSLPDDLKRKIEEGEYRYQLKQNHSFGSEKFEENRISDPSGKPVFSDGKSERLKEDS